MATLVSRAAIWALVFAPLALAGMATGVRAAESAYTKLDFDACETLSSSEEGGSVSLRCAGYGDAPIFYNEGDLRADVDRDREAMERLRQRQQKLRDAVNADDRETLIDNGLPVPITEGDLAIAEDEE